MALAGARAGARPEQHHRARRGQRRQGRRLQDRQRGRDDQGVAGQLGVRRHDVHVQAQPAQRRVHLERQLQPAEAPGVRLNGELPVGLIAEHQRHPRPGAGRQFAQRCQFGGDLAGFLAAPVQHIVRPVQPRVHLLLGEGRLAPAEIGHHLGAVGERLPGPGPHHAGQGGGVVAGPVHRPRLLLHHPPAAAPDAAIEVVVEGRDVRVPLAQVAQLLRLREPELLKEPQRIGIPAGQVQVAAHREVVELGIEAHEVVGDVAARRTAAQDVGLLAVEAHHLVGGEAVVIQPVAGVGLGDRQVRRVDLVEVAVFLRPEHRPPGAVQRLDRLIAPRQPAPERGRRARRIAEGGVVTAELVVGLPGPHGGVAAISVTCQGGNPGALQTVNFAGKTIVSPGSEASWSPLDVVCQDLLF